MHQMQLLFFKVLIVKKYIIESAVQHIQNLLNYMLFITILPKYLFLLRISSIKLVPSDTSTRYFDSVICIVPARPADKNQSLEMSLKYLLQFFHKCERLLFLPDYVQLS